MSKQPPEKREKGDPLRPVDDTDDEREMIKSYYPNLNSAVTPRDWDEPPWGHKEAGDARSRTG